MTNEERTFACEALTMAAEEFNEALRYATEAGLTIVWEKNSSGALYIRKAYKTEVKYFIGREGS